MNRNAPRCILGVVVVALLLAITWSESHDACGNMATCTQDHHGQRHAAHRYLDSAANLHIDRLTPAQHQEKLT
jgi:hypothetical protein